MSLIYTKQDLSNLAAKIQCCAVQYSSKSLKAEKYNLENKKCSLDKLLYLNKVTCIINSYTPPGTLLQEGYTSSATLDFSGFTAFGVLVGNIIVNGVTIAVLPEANYADLASLVTAVVNAINSSGSGYIADDNTDPAAGVVNLQSPGPGSESNGFIVSVVINPQFQLESSFILSGVESYQIITVNNTTSGFYGKTFISAIKPPTSTPLRNYYVYVMENGVITNQIYISNGIGSFDGVGSEALVYDEINDRIYISGLYSPGRFTYLDTNLNLGYVASIVPKPPKFQITLALGSDQAIYNPVNNCKYFVGYNSAVDNIGKLDASEVVTNIGSGVVTTPKKLAIDPANGNIWVLSPTATYIFNTSNALVTTITNVGQIATGITYCAVTNRMLIAYSNPGIIKSFLMNGTIDVNPWYNFGAIRPQLNIFYSSIFKVVFVSDGVSTFILSTAGLLKTTILNEPSSQFSEDKKNQKVISNFTAFSFSGNTTTIRFFNLSNSGTDQIDGALEGGTPDIYSTDSDNCLSEDEIKNIIEVANSLIQS